MPEDATVEKKLNELRGESTAGRYNISIVMDCVALVSCSSQTLFHLLLIKAAELV